jgi:hypothetical protein
LRFVESPLGLEINGFGLITATWATSKTINDRDLGAFWSQLLSPTSSADSILEMCLFFPWRQCWISCVSAPYFHLLYLQSAYFQSTQ